MQRTSSHRKCDLICFCLVASFCFRCKIYPNFTGGKGGRRIDRRPPGQHAGVHLERPGVEYRQLAAVLHTFPPAEEPGFLNMV